MQQPRYQVFDLPYLLKYYVSTFTNTIKISHSHMIVTRNQFNDITLSHDSHSQPV